MSATVKKSIRTDRGMANTTKIQELQNGALVATFPKALAQALGWKKGTTIEWKIENGKVTVEQAK
jgi:antitoxin component of MazEF toxin-antitoxin module